MTQRPLTRVAAIGVVACLLALCACNVTPEDPWDVSDETDDDGASLRIATYNTDTLFDTECDSNECGEGDYEPQPTEEEYAARIEEVAEAIDDLDADVVLLQEVEKEAVLQDLADELDGEYPTAELGELGWAASPDVAVLAKGEKVATREYRDERALETPNGGEDRFAREFLRVDLEIDGHSVIACTAHFRSKRNDNAEHRLAEAEEAREIIDDIAQKHPDSLVIFGGDLNDRPGSGPLEALTDDDGLRRAGRGYGEDEVYTYYFDGQRQAIDHLLNAPTEGGEYVEESAEAFHDREPAGYGGSDHGALRARYRLQ